MKCIGFDATEDHRMQGGGTYAVGKFSICPQKGLPAYKDRYEVQYPLREYGYNRQKCIDVIAATGLPVPPKSACFFCPAMKQIEIQRLAVVDPDMYALALEMERLYRGGKHFRGENAWTVKGKHKQTKEVIEYHCVADDGVAARKAFRTMYDDTVKPYCYELAAYAAVPGLGRNFAWRDVELLPIIQ